MDHSNSIYIRRRSRLIVPKGRGRTPVTVLASLQKEVEQLGYLLAPDVMDLLQALDELQIRAFRKQLIHDLQLLVGAHHQFKPMYPNFPDQVVEMAEAELYFRALMHYWTLEKPETPATTRESLERYPYRKIIRAGNREEFDQILTNLARSKSPYSTQDRQDVHWFVSQYRDEIRRLLPDQIPCKENLATIGAELLRSTHLGKSYLDSLVGTATDVLRLAVGLSGGDVSLATATKFGKFTRAQRVLLLQWVDRAPNHTEDMLRWKSRWIRLGERLHPGEYASRFPRAATAFDIVRNNLDFSTFNSLMEAALAAKDVQSGLRLLDDRPGELARRLDHLVRISSAPQRVVEQFCQNAARVSTPVLLQVMTHFRNRSLAGQMRCASFSQKAMLQNSMLDPISCRRSQKQ